MRSEKVYFDLTTPELRERTFDRCGFSAESGLYFCLHTAPPRMLFAVVIVVVVVKIYC